MIECRLSLKWLYVDCLVSYKSLCWIGYRVGWWGVNMIALSAISSLQPLLDWEINCLAMLSSMDN